MADVAGQLKLFGQLKNFDGLFNFLEHVVDNFPDDRGLLSLPVLSPKPAITSEMLTNSKHFNFFAFSL